ncbi:MAG: DNA cytosine methyltransferase, partial [Pseudomonadota bacterium]
EEVSGLTLPETDLAWASFPCQDLSLAGARAGLKGARSSAFYAFWSLMTGLKDDDKPPRIIVLENVPGFLSSNGGRDFAHVVRMMTEAGYFASALVLDARAFSPQSRRRVFLFGFSEDALAGLGARVGRDAPGDDQDHTPPALRAAVAGLPGAVRRDWRWLRDGPQTLRNAALADLVTDQAGACSDDWFPALQTDRLLAAMSPRQRAALDALKATGGRHVGAAFKRIRSANGAKVLRVEARFDGLAGCLRTPAGGSSRQLIVEINDGAVRMRLLRPREAARLMGLPDDYVLPASATAALKLCGDGVSVPVVQWIGEHILKPALQGRNNKDNGAPARERPVGDDTAQRAA